MFIRAYGYADLAGYASIPENENMSAPAEEPLSGQGRKCIIGTLRQCLSAEDLPGRPFRT